MPTPLRPARLLGLGFALLLPLSALGETTLKPGDKIEISGSATRWYPGEVIEVSGDKVKIRYDGYGSIWDEWMTPDKLRPRAIVEPTKPEPAVATPAPAAPGTIAAGATNAAVAQTGALARPFPARAADAIAGLDGAWLRTESFFWGNSLSLTNHVWFFTANGRVARAPAGGFDPVAFAAADTTAYAVAGVYRVDGDKLIVHWAKDDHPTDYAFERQDDGSIKISGIGCTPVRPLPHDWRFSGTFSGGVSGGGASASSTLVFRSDGSFTRSSAASISTESRESVVSAGSTSGAAGSYAFDGFTLRLVETDGTVIQHTVAAFGAADAAGLPEYLYLDGRMMERSP